MSRSRLFLLMRDKISFLAHHFRWQYLPILIGPVILLGPVWARGDVIFWGTPYLQFTPWWTLAAETLRSGHLPLWNPMLGMGAPLLANYQSALFYPSTWFLLILSAVGGTSWMAWGQAWVVIFHLVWAGLGMALFARQLKMNTLGQVVCAITFELSGYLVARAGFLSINAAVSWLPWILFAGFRLATNNEKKTISLVLPLSLCLGLQLLAGHAQTTYYTILLLAVWMVFWGWRQAGWRKALKMLLPFTIAVLIAVAFSAVQLLPTAEYLSQSQRAGAVGYDFAVNYSFSPLRFLTLFAANLFGSPAQGNYLLKVDNYWEDAVYFGLLPILLAMAAFFRLFRRIPPADNKAANRPLGSIKPLVIFIVCLIVVSFILALGKNSPVFPFLYFHIPTFALFQAPARFTLWAEFGLAILAGIGADGWLKPTGWTKYWINLATAGAGAVILGSLLALFYLPGVASTFIAAMIWMGCLGFISGLLSKFAPTRSNQAPGKTWQSVVLIFISLDLLIAAWGLIPGVSSDLFTTPEASQSAIRAVVQNHRLYIGPASEEYLKFTRFFRLNSFIPEENWLNLQGVYLPDASILAGVKSANNFDPLQPDRYARWMNYLATADTQTRTVMLELMDVSAFEIIDGTSPSGVAYQTVPNPSRLRWSSCAVPASSGEAAWNQLITRVKSMVADKTSTGQPVVLEGMNASGEDCLPQSAAHQAIISENPNQVVIRSTSSSSGWMVLADVWYPGWRATIDGKETPLLRADFLFRGLAVPAGEHVIIINYIPYNLYAGFCISLLSLAGIIIYYIRRLTHADENS